MNEKNFASKNLRSYKDENCILEEQKLEKDYKDLIGKSLDIKSCIRENLLKQIF